MRVANRGRRPIPAKVKDQGPKKIPFIAIKPVIKPTIKNDPSKIKISIDTLDNSISAIPILEPPIHVLPESNEISLNYKFDAAMLTPSNSNKFGLCPSLESLKQFSKFECNQADELFACYKSRSCVLVHYLTPESSQTFYVNGEIPCSESLNNLHLTSFGKLTFLLENGTQKDVDLNLSIRDQVQNVQEISIILKTSLTN